MFRIAAAILLASTAPLSAQVKPSKPVAPLNNPKFNGTVKADTIQILGSGSTGDASGLTAVPNPDAAEGSLSRLAGVSLKRVATVAQLRARAPLPGDVIQLSEGGREGLFVWRSGDYAYPVSIDPRNGVFVKADNVAATAGAWVRAGWGDRCVPASWFGFNYTDDTAAIQSALNLVSNLNVKCVDQGSARTFFSSTINVPAGVRVQGNKSGQWKQIAGTNLGELITLGDDAQLVDIGLDGNWTQNPEVSPIRVAVRIGGANNTVVQGSKFTDFAGLGVVMNGGKKNRVEHNTFRKFFTGAVQIYGAHGYDENYITHNEVSGGGWGGIGVDGSNGNLVAFNRITGYLIGGREGRVTANLSGRTVTWVSGPKFTGATRGSWLVFSNGSEARIASVVSDTVVTTETDLPTLSNTQITLGTGDLSGVVQGSYNRFIGNFLKDTATFGFGYSLNVSGVECSFNDFSENTLVNIGKNAINYSATQFTGGGRLESNFAKNNTIVSSGVAGGIGASDRIAIYLQGIGSGSITNSHIAGNYVLTYSGEGQADYWLGTNGQLDNGSVTVSGNKSVGMKFPGIFNGVKQITLSPNWGSTATATNIVTDGSSVRFTLTSNGTGQNVAGSFVIQKIVEASSDVPTPIATVVNGSGYIPRMYGEDQTTRGNWVAYQLDNFTPAAGQTFEIWMKD